MTTVTLTILGMHCGACEKLVRVELEEAGFGSKIGSLKLENSEKKIGVLILEDVSAEEVEMIKSCINSMDSYEIR